MLTATLIGNLGADALVQQKDGREFVTFRVAHNESYSDSSGQKIEKSMWVDCTINCNGGRPAVLPYLTKGTLVCVIGSLSSRVYSSAKDRCMKAGLTIHVQRVELLGGQSDNFPRVLHTADGVIFNVNKYYNVDARTCVLMDIQGRQYDVDENGWVSIHQDSANADGQ